jgi:hypothetical protein
VEEKKDQGTPEKAGQSSEPGYKLPERDFFGGTEMMDFLGHIEALGDKPAEKAKAPEPEKKSTEKPCKDCPPGETEAKPKEERKPYRVLKVEGKETPVYSEDELVELAQKGAHYTQRRQKDAEWEKDLDERDAKLQALAPQIERIVQFIEGGGKLPTVGDQVDPTKSEGADQSEPEEEILDPAAEKKFKRLEATLAALQKENESLKTKTEKDEKAVLFGKAQKELTESFEAVTKEIPFEQVVDDEEGRNISQEAFAGLFSLKVNRDSLRVKNERGFKMKTVQEYMAETAKDLAKIEKKFKSNGVQPAELTAETVKKNYPKLAEALGQEAVDSYLKSIEDGAAPVIRPSKTEPSITTPKKEITSLDDAIEKGLADPEIAEAMDVLGQQHKRFYSGGK